MIKKERKNKVKRYFKENKGFILTIVLFIALFNIKLPFYIDTPGGAININNRIHYDGKKKYNGSLNMLYVSEYVATVPTYLMSYIIKDWDLVSIKENQISNETTEEIEYRNKIMLDNSINNAKYIAYQEAGRDISVLSRRYIVIGTTSENEFKIGDEILEVNDKKIDGLKTIKEEIESHQVGDEIIFKIKRGQKVITKKVKVKQNGDRKEVGIIIVSNYEYKTNPEIELKFKSSESGSSGGMMMALSIFCAISQEDLLKGRNIAGTGTIEEDGSIGEIAGIKYKIIGAYKNHMDVVLVPSNNYKEAVDVVKERGYDMDIVEVKTFKDAIYYLRNS